MLSAPSAIERAVERLARAFDEVRLPSRPANRTSTEEVPGT
jgi:hypothetical protein